MVVGIVCEWREVFNRRDAECAEPSEWFSAFFASLRWQDALKGSHRLHSRLCDVPRILFWLRAQASKGGMNLAVDYRCASADTITLITTISKNVATKMPPTSSMTNSSVDMP